MKLEVKDIPAKLAPFLAKIRRYTVLIFIVSALGAFGFLVYRVGSLLQAEPTEEAITEKLKDVRRPRIDENALQKIQELQDQNITVQSLFKQARDNPFQE